MPRPGPDVVLEQELEFATLQITESRDIYQLLYKGKPFGIRRLIQQLGRIVKQYSRTTYDNEGSARATTRKLNQTFNTQDFTYKKITF